MLLRGSADADGFNGGQVANPTFLDSLYTYAWFVTFGLSFVLYLVVAKRRWE